MSSDRAWVLLDDLGWITATIVGPGTGNKVKVRLDFNNQVTPPKHMRISPYQETQVKKTDIQVLIQEELKVVDDLITLDDLNEPILLYNLKERYSKNLIYTRIGPIIVSINPFKKLPLYSDQDIMAYHKVTDPKSLPPHLYTVAQNAYSNLVEMAQSQSVIISGESGAGKTEATKIILKFLMRVATDETGGSLTDKILATNPILEAFGNAKTVRNNNSSRFGKLIKIEFLHGAIRGATVSNYLLEASRVVTQASEERNYHVFYQMLKGATSQEKLEYHLLPIDQYTYLTQGDVSYPGDDGANWTALKESFNQLTFSAAEQREYFVTLSAILHLGNLNFVGEDKVTLSPTSIPNLERIATMLQVSSASLKTALEQRLFITPRATSYYIPLTLPQAFENRDALAKALYSKMFDWLIDRINQCLGSKTASVGSLFIAILDIYGFELFDTNSMEQFCINYANEKLHNQFNQHMFTAEQYEYQKEGIPWKDIIFRDNKGCIDLIEKNGVGLIALLNEECAMPKGNEQSLMRKFKQHHESSEHFGTMASLSVIHPAAINKIQPTVFEIVHYADTVAYSIEGFLLKNKNTLNADIARLLMVSQNKNISKAFGDDGEVAPKTIEPTKRQPGLNKSQTARGQSNKATQCTIFKRELQALADLLESSNRHYIRCIKPNETKAANHFQQSKVLNQLKSNGILETVVLRRQGYASKMIGESFFKRYKILGVQSSRLDLIKEFLEQTHGLGKEWAIGNTKVFIKTDAVALLEHLRAQKLDKAALTIQSFTLRFNASLLENVLRAEQQKKLRNFAAIQVQSLIRRELARKEYFDYTEEKQQAEIIKKHKEQRQKEEELKKAEWLRIEEEIKKNIKQAEREKQEQFKASDKPHYTPNNPTPTVTVPFENHITKPLDGPNALITSASPTRPAAMAIKSKTTNETSVNNKPPVLDRSSFGGHPATRVFPSHPLLLRSRTGEKLGPSQPRSQPKVLLNLGGPSRRANVPIVQSTSTSLGRLSEVIAPKKSSQTETASTTVQNDQSFGSDSNFLEQMLVPTNDFDLNPEEIQNMLLEGVMGHGHDHANTSDSSALESETATTDYRKKTDGMLSDLVSELRVSEIEQKFSVLQSEMGLPGFDFDTNFQCLLEQSFEKTPPLEPEPKTFPDSAGSPKRRTSAGNSTKTKRKSSPKRLWAQTYASGFGLSSPPDIEDDRRTKYKKIDKPTLGKPIKPTEKKKKKANFEFDYTGPDLEKLPTESDEDPFLENSRSSFRENELASESAPKKRDSGGSFAARNVVTRMSKPSKLHSNDLPHIPEAVPTVSRNLPFGGTEATVDPSAFQRDPFPKRGLSSPRENSPDPKLPFSSKMAAPRPEPVNSTPPLPTSPRKSKGETSAGQRPSQPLGRQPSDKEPSKHPHKAFTNNPAAPNIPQAPGPTTATPSLKPLDFEPTSSGTPPLKRPSLARRPPRQLRENSDFQGPSTPPSARQALFKIQTAKQIPERPSETYDFQFDLDLSATPPPPLPPLNTDLDFDLNLPTPTPIEDLHLDFDLPDFEFP